MLYACCVMKFGGMHPTSEVCLNICYLWSDFNIALFEPQPMHNLYNSFLKHQVTAKPAFTYVAHAQYYLLKRTVKLSR